MRVGAPTVGQIRTAKSNAVGGMRKRCKKGKNCSAACIQQGMVCLVDLPESAGRATTKVRDMLRGRVIFKPTAKLGGTRGGGRVDPNMALAGEKFTPKDLDAMQRQWDRFSKTGTVAFPFKMPAKYDDKSGTPEAINELVSLRDQLKQDKKTGRIEIPKGVKVSEKAKALVDEWNKLDLSKVYTSSVMGTALNVNGLGVQAGPRNAVPKDALRGLIQYYGLRRQGAELEPTKDGNVITSYRDPFTGQRRPFMQNGKIAASQDHWERPFGLYGIRSENDVKNTVYMPVRMNTDKGESSPARYIHRSLISNGRLQDTQTVDKGAVGGFQKRYDKDASKDFLPRGITRESERLALAESSKWMVAHANKVVNDKYVPKIQEALKGEPTMDQASKLISDIVKQESKKNYHGRDILFSQGARILTPYEQNIAKGVKRLDKAPTAELVGDIKRTLEATGKTPKQILQEVLDNRVGSAKPQTLPLPQATPAPVKSAGGNKTTQPSVNLEERFSQSTKTLGSGMYGVVRETNTGTVVKKGDLGENEVTIQNKLSDVKGVPKIHGVQYLSAPNKSGERVGVIEMDKASGTPLIDLTSKSNHGIKGAEATKVLDEYMRLRKDIHTRGISHGDMHDSNVTWDGKRMGLIDFGNSKQSYKEALGEALGTQGVDHAKYLVGDLKDWGAMSPREVKFQENLANIRERAMKPDLTEPEAKTLVEALYNGV